MKSNYQQRLFNYQETPSPGCWEKIASNLTNESSFPQKLYEYQAKPNAAVWQKIANDLDLPTGQNHRIPNRRITTYAAVAAAVLLIALITFFSMEQKAGTTPVSSIRVKQETKPSVVQSNNNPSMQASSNSPSALSPTTLYTPAATNNKQQPTNSVAATLVKRTSGSTLTERIIKRIKESSDNNANPAVSYLSFTDGDVKFKLPRKVLPLINCPDGDASCLERIKTLQQKISSASMNTDFSGFIEILKHVQENY